MTADPQTFVPHYVHAPWCVSHDPSTGCLSVVIPWGGDDYDDDYVYLGQFEGAPVEVIIAASGEPTGPLSIGQAAALSDALAAAVAVASHG